MSDQDEEDVLECFRRMSPEAIVDAYVQMRAYLFAFGESLAIFFYRTEQTVEDALGTFTKDNATAALAIGRLMVAEENPRVRFEAVFMLEPHYGYVKEVDDLFWGKLLPSLEGTQYGKEVPSNIWELVDDNPDVRAMIERNGYGDQLAALIANEGPRDESEEEVAPHV